MIFKVTTFEQFCCPKLNLNIHVLSGLHFWKAVLGVGIGAGVGDSALVLEMVIVIVVMVGVEVIVEVIVRIIVEVIVVVVVGVYSSTVMIEMTVFETTAPLKGNAKDNTGTKDKVSTPPPGGYDHQ
jgi:hypothetical protein